MAKVKQKEALVPVSVDDIRCIQLAEDEIVVEITNEYFKKHPECYQGDENKLKMKCREDLKHHLDLLINAFIVAETGIFTKYVDWLKNVLESRNLSLDHPLDSFRFLMQAILQRVSTESHATVTAILQYGIDLLEGKFQSGNPVAVELVPLASEYKNSIVEGNRLNASAVVDKAFSQGMGYVDIGVDMIQQSMHEVGRLWQMNTITVAQEHMATAISQNILARAFGKADFQDANNLSAVFACVQGNHHALGLRMLSDTFEVAGWDTDFLGADTPNTTLLEYIGTQTPEVLGLSISMPNQFLNLRSLLDEIRVEMGAQTPNIIIGGLVFENHHDITQKLKVDAYYENARDA